FPRLPDAGRYARLRQAHAGWLLTSYTRLEAGAAAAGPATDGADREHAAETHTAPATLVLGEATLPPEDPARRLPGGASMGIFLHEVLEELPLEELAEEDPSRWAAGAETRRLLLGRARRNGIPDDALGDAAALLHRALRQPQRHGPLALPRGFAGLGPARVAEMRFHFPLPEPGQPALGEALPAARERPFEIGRGVLRGVIDLVFEHEGRTYVLDWKSDRVPLEAAALEAHVAAHYGLQAKLYTLGVIRHLGLRERARYEAEFGGLLYAFLRAMHAPDAGVVHQLPSWDEVLAWEEELRSADRPFGYALRREEARA
ncbi:MAG: PD-(D/E)XK nuclease family protein, partial [Myxococcota bacterium]